MNEGDGLWSRVARWVRQAIGEFLAVPIAIVGGFILFAVGIYFLDQALWTPGRQPPPILRPLSDVFGGGGLGSLLGTVATSLITVTSITFSLLLLAVQQGASALTNQVVDQFLRRRSNQFYFGFFVGLSVFALINLLTANQAHRPIFGALTAVLMTAIALCLIVVLIYTTIDQMRPSMIVKAIHDHVIKARKSELALLQMTRRTVSVDVNAVRQAVSERQGYVTSINAARLAHALAGLESARAGSVGHHRGVEIKLLVVIGSHVAYHDSLAELRSAGDLTEAHAQVLTKAVIAAIRLDDERNLDRDPGLGIRQLSTIGWTSVSTAHSNPQPGLLVCEALRDIIARWSEPGEAAEDRSSPVVYEDRVPGAAISALESLAVVASESMQHQTLAEVMRSFAALLPKLPPERADRVADAVLRSLSALGEHVLTHELESALDALYRALAAADRAAAAGAVARAKEALRRSVGVLRSRATRAETGDQP